MSNKKRTKDTTKKVNTTKTNTKKNSNKKGNDKKRKHPKLILALKILAIIIVACIIIGAGVVAGLFFGFFGEDLKITADALNIKTENSVLIDINGNEVAKLNGDENREVILMSEMGEYLPKAFVAIEDKRFYDHNGVDIKRTLGAVMKFATGNSSYGGSTITQQLIKNATGEKKKHWSRKVKEIVKAYQIEREMSKDQILESYLNTIPLGGGGKNVYGVKVAAKYYFDKKPAELSLAEASYIAGINHSPNVYNPFKETPNTEKIVKRTKTVLDEMKDQGKIEKEQYDQAIAEVDAGLAFKEGNVTSNNSLTQNEEAAVKQVINQYAEEHDLEYKIAEQQIKSGGYKIYITENKEIQNILDKEYTENTSWMTTTKSKTKKDENGNKITVQMQSGMAIIDHKTGYVVASRGVLGEKTAWGTDRSTSAGMQPGSSIKPIAVIAPSLQEGLITPATVVDDTPVSFGSYKPHNDDWTHKGLYNIRSILRESRNIPEVKMMKTLGPSKSIEYLKSFGVSTVDESKDAGLALALGGVSHGISPLEMAAAYATLANDGVYIEPTFYIKVEDSKGNIVLEKKQETHRVISEQNAYLVQSLLTEPTGTGLTGSAGATATGARVNGMQTCGKTGTADETKITWFCGFTPYYSGAMYFAYDEKDAKAPGSGTVARRWGGIMNKVHKGLESAKFDKPSNIVSATVCKYSGLLPTENCAGHTYTEMFVKGTVPSKTCSTHVKLKICKETGKIANEFCKDVEEKVFITRENRDKDTSWQSAADAGLMAPTENCDKHTKAQDTEKPVITLKGEATVTVKLKEEYKDAGATATDKVDGDLTSKIKTEIKKDGKVVEKIDTTKTGTYTITYTVSDAAGNTATKTRTVKIVDQNTNTNTNTTNTNTTTTNKAKNTNNTNKQ